nr:hypothetical protein [Tanacetum cinerariifolium]
MPPEVEMEKIAMILERVTVGHDVAYVMTWTNLKKKMTNKYSPRGEIKKLEVKMWNLKVKGTDMKLALMYARMFPEESDKIERYVRGFPDMIYGSVMASKPKTMQDAIEFATELMEKKIRTLAERQAQNKRKLDNNQAQQQPPKKQGVAISYTVRSGERKEYARTQPLCNKCKFHHNGQCTLKCANCKKVGHLTRDCRSPTTTNNQRNLTCYECGNQRHYKSDFSELKNQNHGNQAGGVANVLAERDATKSRNGEDSHDSETGVRRQAPLARECTYPDFMKYQPLYIKGTKGVVELTQWTVGHDVAYVMTWTNLKKKMTDKYSPRSEIKKLEVEMWNLKVKGTDVSNKIERYVGGLPDMIHESVMASKPKTMQDTIEFATELIDKKISTLAERQAQNKRKLNNNNKLNNNHPRSK